MVTVRERRIEAGPLLAARPLYPKIALMFCARVPCIRGIFRTGSREPETLPC
jgi:hypothetical protein